MTDSKLKMVETNPVHREVERWDVAVVLRSANERTEEFALQLIKSQIPDSRIAIVKERPFAKALEKSIDTGLDFGLAWTLCIDADVLIFPNAIDNLLDEMSDQPCTSFGMTGRIFDKFYDRPKSGGPHLYRTNLLTRARSLVKECQNHIRPETQLKTLMGEQGFGWVSSSSIFGIHDYEQYYRDIFRKMAVRARKSHQGAIDDLMTRATLASKWDKDFLVALWGFRYGKSLSSSDEIPLDIDYWNEFTKPLIVAYGLEEKAPLSDLDKKNLQEQLRVAQSSSQMKTQHDKPINKSKLSSMIWWIGNQIKRIGNKLERLAFGHE
jgi:hypothetical protein